ncbi:MAG: helix-turn-helix domain-containing protein [Candidatus Saccharibacteria bacterium]|nr:helix-turn-helix domain-containing protein [Candidatus Saccharibacteria bacterium]
MNTSLLKNIGIVIVNLRKTKGLSQERLALNANIDRRYMCDIENGRRNISVEMLSKIAKALEITASEILRKAEEE